MSIELHFPGNEKNEQKRSGEENSNVSTQNVDISLPNPERPQGPFEHSGETAGWTVEEEKEKTDQQE